MNVSRSGYYKYLNQRPSARDIENQVLSNDIKKILEDHKSSYGSLRISKVLVFLFTILHCKQESIKIGHNISRLFHSKLLLITIFAALPYLEEHYIILFIS